MSRNSVIKALTPGADFLGSLVNIGKTAIPDPGRREKMNKLDKAIMWGALAVAIFPSIKGLIESLKRDKGERTCLLFFPDSSIGAEALLEWVEENSSELASDSDIYQANMNWEYDDEGQAKEVAWWLKTEAIKVLQFEDTSVIVERTENFQPNESEVQASKEWGKRSFRAGYKVTFNKLDKDLLQRFMDALTSSYTVAHQSGKKKSRSVCVWNWRWAKTSSINGSATVCLPEGVMEDLEMDLTRFINSKADYDKLGIPYRRGYLLHGIPRSGKTATIRYLAGRLDRNLYLLPLSNINNEKVREAMAEVPEDSILVIEDLDSISLDLRGDAAESSEKVNLDFLLNVLDGLSTQSGQIVFLTANDLTNLDEKLLMKGRVDKKVEFGHATREQIVRYGQLLGIQEDVIDKAQLLYGDGHHVMADVQEVYVEAYFRNKENTNNATKQNDRVGEGHGPDSSRIRRRSSSGGGSDPGVASISSPKA